MIPLQTLHFHLFNYNADSTIQSIPTYIAFIYSIDQSLLISFIYSIDQKKVLREPYLGVVAVTEEEADVDDGGSTGGDRRRRQRWCRRRPASMAVVVTDRVECSGHLECFGMNSETTRGGLLFIGSKISAAILN
jgi:hypothetical protein